MRLDNTSPILQQLLTATRIIFPCTLLLVIIDQLPFLTNALDRGQTIGRDAFNFWMAGKLAWEGNVEHIYDNPVFMDAIRKALGPDAGLHAFPYPPPALIFFYLFGWMPYWVALSIWSALGIFGFIIATKGIGTSRKNILLSLIAPLTIYNIILGQNGLISAALFIAGLRLANTSQISSGILIGCLSFKPTLAILLPFILLIKRKWTAIFVSSLTTAFLCLLPILLWGPSIWLDYLHKAAPYQQELLEFGTGLAQLMKPSAFISMRLLGFNVELAYSVQALFSIITLAILINYGLKRNRARRIENKEIIITAIATMLIIPYVHFYDMALVAGGILLMTSNSSNESTLSILQQRTLGLLWTLPVISLLMNIIGFPITPLILVFCLYILCKINTTKTDTRSTL